MRQMRQEAKKGVRFAGLRTYTVQSSCLPTTWSTLYGAHKDIELVRELPARDAEVVFAAAPMLAAGKRSKN
jgi:Protein-L-isoaspartate(D-aspartate) O-methyltransferase (PCMT)